MRSALMAASTSAIASAAASSEVVVQSDRADCFPGLVLGEGLWDRERVDPLSATLRGVGGEKAKASGALLPYTEPVSTSLPSDCRADDSPPDEWLGEAAGPAEC